MPQSEPEWLRETVDDGLVGLFSDNRDDISSTVGRLLERLPYDPELENELIDTLQSALELENDDTDGSVWITLLLGEAAVTCAVPTFVDALGRDASEELQTVAGIAILKCGTPGIEHLIECIDDEDPSPVFLRAAFQVLAYVGYLRDDDLRERVMAYLTEKLETEVITEASLHLVEGVATAAGWLGHVQLLPKLREVSGQFGNSNAVLEDAIGMLDDKDEGVAVSGDLLPGEEDYHWAFEYSGDAFRAESDDPSLEAVERVEGAAQANVEDDESAAGDDEERIPNLESFEGYVHGLGSETLEADDDE